MQRNTEQDENEATEHGEPSGRRPDASVSLGGFEDPSMQPNWNFKAIRFLKHKQPQQSEDASRQERLTSSAQTTAEIEGAENKSSGVDPFSSRAEAISGSDAVPLNLPLMMREVHDSDESEVPSLIPLDRSLSDTTIVTKNPFMITPILGKSHSDSNLGGEDNYDDDEKLYNLLSSKSFGDSQSEIEPRSSSPVRSSSSIMRPITIAPDGHIAVSKGGYEPISTVSSTFTSNSPNVAFSVNEDSVDVKHPGSTVASTTMTEIEGTLRMHERRCYLIMFLACVMFVVIVALAVSLAVVALSSRKDSTTAWIIAPSSPPPIVPTFQPTYENSGSSTKKPISRPPPPPPSTTRRPVHPSIMIHSQSPQPVKPTHHPIRPSRPPLTLHPTYPATANPTPTTPFPSVEFRSMTPTTTVSVPVAPLRPTPQPVTQQAPITPSRRPYPDHDEKLTRHPVIPLSFITPSV